MVLTAGWKTLLAAAGAVLALQFVAAPALARTNHAVLIGVGDYPGLPKSKWLKGPVNDVVLVRDYLTSAAPVPFANENITVLADGVEGAAEPTRAEILKALDAVPERVGRGDLVYLQFSGHGFHQTAQDPSTETDGLDEIFLPKDTGKWVDRSVGMPNAILDDEIGAALDRIRERGAFVWVVFDACHSGTATRAAFVDPDVVDRNIGPEDVGMPAEILVEAAAAAEGTRGEPTRENSLGLTDEDGAAAGGKGGMVAFFAAQTDETTPEMPLPAGQAGARKLGLFTYTLFREIEKNPNVTYRQLGQSVLQSYSAINRPKTTPLFEGDLDAPVFGTMVGDTIRQWPITVAATGITIPAGIIQGFGSGTRLAIMDSPGSPNEAARGILEVVQAGNVTSTVMPVATEDMPKLAVADFPPNAYARLVEIAVDFRMKVARAETEEGFEEVTARVNAMLEAIAVDEKTPVSIDIVEPGAEADLRLAVFSEASLPEAGFDAVDAPAIWFLPPSGELDMKNGRKPPAIVMESGDDAAVTAALQDYLTRIFRATNLARLASTSDYSPEDFEVEFTLQRSGSGAAERIERGKVPFGYPDDIIAISAKNNSDSDVDLNILYVGSDYSITHMRSERLRPGAQYPGPGQRDAFLQFEDRDFGMERLVTIMTEAPPLSDRLDLGYMAQPGAKMLFRGDKPTTLAEMLSAMSTAATTRAAKVVGGEKKARGAVMVFPVETLPR